ncbi:MAG: NADH-quinone oxidoreductase subunit N [Acidobacteria bacterium]|jgi:NADH-quinone oxidoreductase subunit N|nr:NADH-quinone oxidoreductase subunit N [Acidobacteriota bacterium]
MFLQNELVNPNADVSAILPEIMVAITGIIVMLFDSFVPKQRYITGIISLIGIVFSGILLGLMWGDAPYLTAWSRMIAHDSLRISFSFVFLLVTAMTILISSVWTEREDVPVGEYHCLLLFATVGMMFMASGNDLVVLFLGLETSSLATYVMAGLRKSDLRSNESAMKYFILGSFASAFLLYGMALIYGATGSTNITEIALRIANPNFPALLLVGGAMMIIGFGFKVATVPFHVWTPDVYEGAPTPVTAFMAAGPKAAAFASFVRVFVLGFPLIAGVQASVYLHDSWITALTVMAGLTMTVGNIAAIVQNNVKRMLAYSSIAHAGYALVGFIGAGMATTADKRDAAIASVAFYMLTYAITNLGAFAIVALLGQKNDRRTEFEDYNGIGFKSPVLAFALSLFMLSLLGLPLTAGFMGKVLVFRPALEAGNAMLTLLVVVAVINTAISAYYYLRLVVVMFFRDRTDEWFAPRIPTALAAVLVITIVGVLYFGIFSNGVIERFSQSPARITVKAEK